ncbi:EVE domain-containing protein [Candidatus Albibeggiatoa sp. nov. BB20]|uniref:EVE domain-containing protein n=1 Tax=Candidatus Albibeggiatoa sp. nov. BB20 TaxID=3162723 RepID=UPI0033659400
MAYWLMKSEPNAFSIDDLAKVQIEPWDGVRNYQARNMMRDQMQIGDLVFFYHSNCKIPAIVGMMKIVKAGYVDNTAFDPDEKYYDPKSKPDSPRWYRVDVAFVEKFEQEISLHTLKQQAELADLALVRKGSRLSIMPVSEPEWQCILGLK